MVISRRFQRGRPLLVLILFTNVCFLTLFTFYSCNIGGRTEATTKSLSETLSVEKIPPSHLNGPPTDVNACTPRLGYIRNGSFDLTDSIRYSRRCVKMRFDKEINIQNHRQVHRLSKPLISRQITVNFTSCDHQPLPECEPLVLSVAPPYPDKTYGHLLFGLSSTYDRLYRSLDGFAHWLGGSGALVVALVYDTEPPGSKEQRPLHNLRDLEAEYRAHGINLRAFTPRNYTLSIAQNHFAVIESLLEAATSKTRWLAIVDDDTFLPSLYKLDQALQQHDHTRATWLGALSEDFDSVANWGYMAYGGAGVFLSLPLAQQLLPAHLNDCLSSATLPTGDAILRDCIYRHTATKLTLLPGLYQHDLYGDISGFYESGVLPLSVHHWRSWYKEPLPQMAAITRVCGDCFLQRWQFSRDTLLANGFSITQYPRHGGLGGGQIDLGQMEQTWSHAGREFDFSLGPLRTALSTDEKKSYRLVASGRDNGVFRQTYLYRGSFSRDEVDEVFELFWETTNEQKGGEGA